MSRSTVETPRLTNNAFALTFVEGGGGHNFDLARAALMPGCGPYISPLSKKITIIEYSWISIRISFIWIHYYNL